MLFGRKQTGFVLTALLAVTAILPIHAAVQFASARDSVMRKQCLSNLMKISIALEMYAQDNDGKFPYLTKANIKPGYPSNYGTTVSGELIDKLAPYNKDKQIFYCPTEKNIYDNQANNGFFEIGYYYFCCDSWSTSIISQKGNPKRILMMDIGVIGTRTEGTSGHGYSQANYLFTDGHVQNIPEYRYPDTSLMPNFANPAYN